MLSTPRTGSTSRTSRTTGGTRSRGGAGGAPVRDKSTHIVSVLAAELAGRLPIIAVGGITEGKHAAEKIAAGASLVQIYSGFIYKGPALIREAVDAIAGLPKKA